MNWIFIERVETPLCQHCQHNYKSEVSELLQMEYDFFRLRIGYPHFVKSLSNYPHSCNRNNIVPTEEGKLNHFLLKVLSHLSYKISYSLTPKKAENHNCFYIYSDQKNN